ncbi:MAG: DUF484 family protein [Woeseiaceae bacterium]|nr:DUF484 family protein [Woeseiaceae bacterium]
MSTQRKPEYLEESLSEETIVDYLENHPDFFERHASLLGALRLPHASGGAVSLVERQVSVLRQKDLKLERQLKELIAVARDNDVLAAKIHALSLQLMGSTDLPGTIAAIEEAVRAGFSADHGVLVVFGDPDAFADVDAGRFFRAVSRDDEALKPFGTFLAGNGPRCGQARDTQLDYLFRDDAADVGSVALVPLGPKAEIGFLAIASTDAKRFHPGMSMDFLARVGDLVAAALKRF